MKKTVIKIISLVLALVLFALPLASCANKPILKLDDKEISTNLYEFLLCRMKGALGEMGYKISDEGFWNTIVSADGTTYGDYVKAQVLKQAYSYLVADYLFDKEGLTLPDEDISNIDALMDKLVERAGSKIALNSELSAYGVNYKMLKEIYTIEAKMAHLKEYYYGESGEKISNDEKDKYLNDNFVAFKQVFLAGYYYQTEVDDDGNTIYFVNGDERAIAYDKENGKTKQNEFGNLISDKYGNPVYFNDDGTIAYDKENGVVSYMVDENGDKIAEYYGDELLAEIKERADVLAGTPKTAEEFDALISSESEIEGDDAVRYLYVSPSYYFNQSSSAKYLDDIAAALDTMNIGEMRVVESDYGYHIIYKYENESGAYDKEEYADAFATFNSDLADLLFSEKCAEYESKIDYNSELFEKTPSMIEVGANTLY